MRANPSRHGRQGAQNPAAEFARRRRRRNVVIALALAGFVAIVFFATMAKLRYLLPAG